MEEQENKAAIVNVMEEPVLPSRQPLQDVVHNTKTNIRGSSVRCKIPVPKKTLRASNLKPPATLSGYADAIKKKPNQISCQREKTKLPNHQGSVKKCNCVEKLCEEGKVLIDSEEYKTLKHDVHVTKRGLLLMEKLNEKTSEELAQAKTEAESSTADLNLVKRENAALKQEAEEMEMIMAKCSAIKPEDKSLLEFLEEKLKVDTERTRQLQEKERELKEYTDNLYRELQCVVSSQEETIKKNKSALAYKDHELERQRSVILELKTSLEQFENVKEAMDFLEAEHSMLLDERIVLKEGIEVAALRLKTCEQELKECRDRLTVRDKEYQHLQDSSENLRAELSQKSTEAEAMKTVGREILKDQSRQMRQCGQTVSKVTHELTTLLRTLLCTTGMKVSSSLVKDFGKNASHPWVNSLVSSVLEAIGEADEDESAKMTTQADVVLPGGPVETVCQPEAINVGDEGLVTESVGEVWDNGSVLPTAPGDAPSPATCSRVSLGSSFTTSAFQPVKSIRLGNQFPEIPEQASSEVSSAGTAPETPCSKARRLLGICDEADGNTQTNLTEDGSHLSAIANEVTRINRVLEQAALLSIQDLRKENDYLTEELEVSRKKCSLKEEEFEKLELELQTARSREKELSSEKDILSIQQDSLVEKLQSSVADSAPLNSVAAVESKFYKETLHLQKTVYILRQQLSAKTELCEELGNKASRRMKVLAQNWNRADEEVRELDKMLENVRVTLHRNKSVFKNSEPLNKLLKNLDGKTDEGNKSLKKPLPTVKTSKW